MAAAAKITLLAMVIITATAATTEYAYTTPYLIACFSTIWCFKINRDKNYAEDRLHDQEARYQALQAQLKETQEKLNQLNAKLDGEVSGELRKVRSVAESKQKDAGLRPGYWDQIERMTSPYQGVEVEKLMKGKEKVQEMIELTRKKYRTGVIDGDSCKKITDEYLKQLIDIESQINALTGKHTPPTPPKNG